MNNFTLAPSLSIPAVRDIKTSVRPAPRQMVSADELESKLGTEMLFMVSYVPFVIAEIAWDYADSCVNIASSIGMAETKKLCRDIRMLREDYLSERKGFVDSNHLRAEGEHMLAFQEDYKDFFYLLHINIKGIVAIQSPDLSYDREQILLAAYACSVVLRALFRYAVEMKRRIEKLLSKRLPGILMPQLYRLDELALRFTKDGGKTYPDRLTPFVDTLSTYILQTEILK